MASASADELSRAPTFSASHWKTGAAMFRSSATRWPAPSKRCTSACGSRLMRSLRYRSEKIGIPRAPEHQGRDLQPAQPFGDAAERREAGVGGVHGNVRDKISHPGAAVGSAVGGHEGAADVGGQRRVGQRVRHPQERVRRRRSPAVHGGVQGKPQGRRDCRAGGLVDGGVGQHHPGELLRVRQGPAQADHATPVVARRSPPARPGRERR